MVGVLTVASPLAFWWLDPSTVYALGLVLIAPVDIGFAVAVTGSVWLIVAGLVGRAVGHRPLTPALRHVIDSRPRAA